MKTRIISKNYEPGEKLTNIIEKKLSKLDRFFIDEPEATVTLKNVKKDFIIEASVTCEGLVIRAEKPGKNFYYAIDNVLEVLEKQIIKNRNKLQQKVHFAADAVANEQDEAEPEIKRIKHFTVKPMDVYEAILQLELSDHDFYVFVNSSNGKTSVIYKRNEGDYGLIEPAE